MQVYLLSGSENVVGIPFFKETEDCAPSHAESMMLRSLLAISVTVAFVLSHMSLSTVTPQRVRRPLMEPWGSPAGSAGSTHMPSSSDPTSISIIMAGTAWHTSVQNVP